MYRLTYLTATDCHVNPGLEETDVLNAVFTEELLDGLPATPYPLAVDINLAKQGQGY
ncbi:MAG: hypothetical protein IPH22_16400 [Nitrosomonas sp.]|nr:hypothetical protein [Nitrosomonas sp.]